MRGSTVDSNDDEGDLEEVDADRPMFSLVTGKYRHARRFGGKSQLVFALAMSERNPPTCQKSVTSIFYHADFPDWASPKSKFNFAFFLQFFPYFYSHLPFMTYPKFDSRFDLSTFSTTISYLIPRALR